MSRDLSDHFKESLDDDWLVASSSGPPGSGGPFDYQTGTNQNNHHEVRSTVQFSNPSSVGQAAEEHRPRPFHAPTGNIEGPFKPSVGQAIGSHSPGPFHAPTGNIDGPFQPSPAVRSVDPFSNNTSVGQAIGSHSPGPFQTQTERPGERSSPFNRQTDRLHDQTNPAFRSVEPFGQVVGPFDTSTGSFTAQAERPGERASLLNNQAARLNAQLSPAVQSVEPFGQVLGPFDNQTVNHVSRPFNIQTARAGDLLESFNGHDDIQLGEPFYNKSPVVQVAGNPSSGPFHGQTEILGQREGPFNSRGEFFSNDTSVAKSPIRGPMERVDEQTSSLVQSVGPFVPSAGPFESSSSSPNPAGQYGSPAGGSLGQSSGGRLSAIAARRQQERDELIKPEQDVIYAQHNPHNVSSGPLAPPPTAPRRPSQPPFPTAHISHFPSPPETALLKSHPVAPASVI